MSKSQGMTIYHRILKIPNHITEPNAYELLGLSTFEKDAQQIKQAALDRNALLQRMQNAENYQDVKRIEREVGQALVLLSNPETKAEYDRGLDGSVPIMEPPPVPKRPKDSRTQSLAAPQMVTEEVIILPDDPPVLVEPAEATPADFTFPAPSAASQSTGEKRTDEGESFLPGEAPWSLKGKGKPRGLFGAVVLVVFLLGAGLLYSFWLSSSADRSQANNETKLAGKPEEAGRSQGGKSSSKSPSESARAAIQNSTPAADEKPAGANNLAITAANANRLTVVHTFQLEQQQPETTGSPSRSSHPARGVISIDGEHVAWRDPDGRLTIHETRTGKARHRLPIIVYPNGSFRFSADGKSLIAAEANGWLSSWDVATGQPLDRIPFKISTLFSPQVVAAARLRTRWVDPSEAGVANLRSRFDNLAQNTAIALGEGNLGGFSFTADGRYLAAYHDYELQLWDLGDPNSEPNPKRLSKVKIPYYGVFAAMALSPDGKQCAIGLSSGRVFVYSTDEGLEVTSFLAQAGRLKAVDFSDDGTLLLTTGMEGDLRIWNAADWTPLARLAPPEGANADPVAGYCLTGDARQILVVHESGRGLVWEVGTSENPQVIAFTSKDNANSTANKPANSIGAANLSTISKWADFRAHAGAIEHVAYSNDGNRLITAGEDGAIRIWDSASGKLERQISLTSPPTNPPAGFSPFQEAFDVGAIVQAGVSKRNFKHLAVSADNLLATTADGKTIRLYDIGTGSSQGTIGNSGESHAWFGFAQDGKSLVIRSGGTGFEVWGIESRKLEAVFSPPSQPPLAFAVAPESSGYVLATGDAQGVITLWADGHSKKTLPGGGAPIMRLEFSGDGEFLASYDHLGIVKLHSLEKLAVIARERPWNYASTALRFAPNGPMLLFLSQNGRLEALSTDSTNAGKSGGVYKSTGGNLLAISPDGKQLAIAAGTDFTSASKRGTVELWGLGSRPAGLNPTGVTESPPINLTANPIIHKNAITPANLKELKELASVVGHKAQNRSNSVHSVEFAQDGTRFVTGGSDLLARVWDPSTSPLTPVLELKGHNYPVMAVAISDSYIATGSSKGYLKIWQRGTGLERPQDDNKAHHSGSIQALAFSPNGKYLASVGQDKDVKIWNVDTMEEAVSLPPRHKATVTGVTWVDDTQILSCDSGNRIWHWKGLISSGASTRTSSGFLGGFGFTRRSSTSSARGVTMNEIRGFGARIHAIASTIDNKAAFASDNSQAGLWNGVSNIPLQLKGHKAAVRAVAFSPDGQILASAGMDSTIRFWNSDTGQSLHTLDIQPGPSAAQVIHDLSFSPDGRWLLSGDSEGVIKLFGLP